MEKLVEEFVKSFIIIRLGTLLLKSLSVTIKPFGRFVMIVQTLS